MSGGGSKISEKYFDSIKKKYIYIYPLMSAQCCGSRGDSEFRA